jgi:hypothetical protein
MKLTRRITSTRPRARGGSRAPSGPDPMVFLDGDRVTLKFGILIDGTVYGLGGQPPVATTKGWGLVPGSKPRRR